MSRKTIYEILTDENCDDNLFLQDEAGNECEFEVVATVSMEEGLFCLLHPLFGDEEDVAVVYQWVPNEGEGTLVPVSDEDIAEGVYNEYCKMLAEEE